VAKIQKTKKEAQDVVDIEARKILSSAIQRLATEHVAESTISSVNLPSDEMKGRIIGREGRNIQLFEKLTGVDVIIDDTPEAVVLSSFDPVRRHIAKMALDRLIADGRIQPAKIEEAVAKAEKDRNLLEAPPPSSLSFLDKGLLTGIYGFMAPAVAPPIFSVYGAYEQVSGWAQNLWSSAVSKIGSLSASMLSLVGGGSDISVAPPALPEGLTINQAAINQLGEIHPNPSRNEFGTGSLPKEGGGEDDAPIVNIIPQNFPQPINIVPKTIREAANIL